MEKNRVIRSEQFSGTVCAFNQRENVTEWSSSLSWLLMIHRKLNVRRSFNLSHEQRRRQKCFIISSSHKFNSRLVLYYLLT